MTLGDRFKTYFALHLDTKVWHFGRYKIYFRNRWWNLMLWRYNKGAWNGGKEYALVPLPHFIKKYLANHY